MKNLNEIQFDSEKPSVNIIEKTDKSNYLAIGLLNKQVLTKHKTSFKTILTVLKGKILFKIGLKKIELKSLQVFEIPINEEHEVIGLDSENIFILFQEKQ
ncbi:hypothetical protein [Jiulongibacter sediminis]|uniref:Cupin n=1 Tax=Jiulongibacter sediminis TaxID=1605367 RepID=A0A0P7BRI2_9BACT|nr:hypothetical protein [Jiulongibacter sediminis]KPM46911.1 hypothetical protein AFM12_16890 [Jiulongibacter sediminis]TBX22259.1 hypothetical protein TK44_16900 [Jiulongibacter sediminis]